MSPIYAWALGGRREEMKSFVSAFGIEASCPLDGQVINGSLKISNVKFPVVFPAENSTIKYYPSIVAFKFCIIPRNVIFRLNMLVALV